MNKKLIKKMNKDFIFEDGCLNHLKFNVKYSVQQMNDYLNYIDENLCELKDDILYFNIDISPSVVDCIAGKIFTKGVNNNGVG